MTIEPQPAGPMFAHCAFTGAQAGPIGLRTDTNNYNNYYIIIPVYIYTREMRQPARVTGPLRSQLSLATVVVGMRQALGGLGCVSLQRAVDHRVGKIHSRKQN